MASFFRAKRSTRLQFAAVSVAVALFSSADAHAAAPLFDNLTPIENGSTLPSDAGYYFAYPSGTQSSIASSFVGEAYNLPTGTTDLTGVDLLFGNFTNQSNYSTTPQYMGGAGTTYNQFEVNVYVWGSVTPTHLANASNPVLSTTNPAFGSLLNEFTFTVPETLAPGLYSFENQTSPGASPGLSFPTPVYLNGVTTVGITFNIEGSTDGGNTYSNVAGLTPALLLDVPPSVGSQQTNAFYVNDAGETNGSFTQGPHYYQEENAAGTALIPIPNQGVGTRVFGDGTGTTYHWASAVDGTYTTSTNWNPAGVPGAPDTAVFNLGSTSGYTVEVPDNEFVANVQVQNDNLTFNLDAQYSYLFVGVKLTVGQPATNGTAVHGSLTLGNDSGFYTGILEANAIAIGGNGGTGTLTVTNSTYLYSDNDTAINAGSKLAVGAFGKFGTATLTIAGSTNTWTGQLDIGASALNLRNGSIGTVMNQLKTGYNNGKWNGQGIISSVAAADSTHLTAVGAIVNSDPSGNPLYGNGTALGLFDGDSPAASSVLIRYTYYGDANLDGTVDGSDYSLIDNGFLNHLSGWYNGDFNYDGVVDGSDYTLIDNAFNMQGSNIVPSIASDELTPGSSGATVGLKSETSTANFASSNLTISDSGISNIASPQATTTSQIAGVAVPEPTSLALLGIGAISLLRRRNRSPR